MTKRSVRVRRPEGHNELDRRGDVPLNHFRERRSRGARFCMLAEEREHYHARTQGLDVQHQFSKPLLDPLGVADKAVRVDVFDGACLGELF
jgi:hypothetical protein